VLPVCDQQQLGQLSNGKILPPQRGTHVSPTLRKGLERRILEMSHVEPKLKGQRVAQGVEDSVSARVDVRRDVGDHLSGHVHFGNI
jgi:hypothetical protein